MKTISTVNGSRVVKTITDLDGWYSSSLYVNNGETITNIRATHSTLKGAQKWAKNQLSK